jgi:hypothetical protein
LGKTSLLKSIPSSFRPNKLDLLLTIGEKSAKVDVFVPPSEKNMGDFSTTLKKYYGIWWR